MSCNKWKNIINTHRVATDIKSQEKSVKVRIFGFWSGKVRKMFKKLPKVRKK
jgi:hypothetical protein